MSESNRRGFLKVAGAGAAVGAAAVAATAATKSSGTSTTEEPAALPAGASGVLVAYVRDVRGAEVSVLVDGTEVVVQDKDLVARLAAARAKNSA